MGVIPQHLLDELDDYNRADYKRERKSTVVRLPCCGTMIEGDPSHGEEYVTCPNKWCPKRSGDIGARHVIIWNERMTKVRSEAPRLEL